MTLVQRLREAGSTGLDLSPGDPLYIEAADEIERLNTLAPATPVEGEPESNNQYKPWVAEGITELEYAWRAYLAARLREGERDTVIQKVATDAANYLSRLAGNDAEAAEILLDIQEFILTPQAKEIK